MVISQYILLCIILFKYLTYESDTGIYMAEK